MSIVEKIKQIFENTDNPELAAHQLIANWDLLREIKELDLERNVTGDIFSDYDKLKTAIKQWQKDLK